MADNSRFPSLVLPFAIVGAAAGWLSAGLGGWVSQPLAAGCATVVAALTGALLRWTCVRRRYEYEMGDPDPELRPTTDTWWLHVAIVLGAGAITGYLVAALTPLCCTEDWCALGGALCAIVFVPVCLAVLAAARRAQRARLGSLVASCDRRAVWGILGTALAVTTVEALAEWPLAMLGHTDPPVVATALLLAAAGAALAIRRADLRALRRARDEIAAGLAAQDPTVVEHQPDTMARLDLGLGDDLLARFARGAAAYRQQERTVALVRGSPALAVQALQRAVRRGTLALVTIGIVSAVHAAAAMAPARLAYKIRCHAGSGIACEMEGAVADDP